MSLGLRFLAGVLHESADMAVFGTYGVGEEHFLGDDEQRMYAFITDFYRSYGAFPSTKVASVSTTVRLPAVDSSPLGYWADELKKRRLHKLYADASTAFGRFVKDSALDDARDYLETLVREIGTNSTGACIVTSLADLGTVLLDEQRRRRVAVGLSGISFGFPSLDLISDGAQKGDLVVLVGRTGMKKTYMLCRFAIAAHQQGKRVLFATYEMTSVRVAQRLYSLVAGLPIDVLRFARLSSYGEQHLMAVQSTLRSAPGAFHVLKGALFSSVSDLHAAVYQYGPEVVYVDGAYLLNPDSRYTSENDRVSKAATELKGMAQEHEIPVVCSYQLNRQFKSGSEDGIKNIYQTDVLAQLGSLVLGLDDYRKAATYQAEGVGLGLVSVYKGREGETGKFPVRFDFARMDISEYTDDDA